MIPAVNEPQRILLRATNWLGDVVMISPAVALLRGAYPKARLTMLTKAHLADLYAGHRDLDEVITYDPKEAHRGLSGRIRLAGELRRGNYDWAVIFPKGFEAALAPALARIPVRAGWATDRRGFLLTHSVPETAEDFFLHHSEYFARPLRKLGLTGKLPQPHFPLDEAHRIEGKKRVTSLPHPLVVFHPAASIAPRQWGTDRFITLGKALHEKGCGIALIGAPAEAAQAQAIATAVPGALNLAGKTTLKEMAGVIAAADLFVGNDSGPLHIAAALGINTVAIFGAGHPGKTAPLPNGADVVTLHAGLACSPCKQKFWRECDPLPSGRPACLESISASTAIAAAVRLLERI